MTNSEDVGSVLTNALERVREHHAARARDPSFDRALTHVSTWQIRRLRNTYADFEAMPRYAAALAFFETDLYGGTSFAQRDADLARVVPAMTRLLPEHVLRTVVDAIDVNLLAQDLDGAMARTLGSRALDFSVPDYCAAYRFVRQFEDRERQIQLVGRVGSALDRIVRKPMIKRALAMMRRPARIAGLSALQDFLERGFAAFSRMQGADELLAVIAERETLIHRAIVDGDDAPFPDPVQPAVER
jgi:hypothetical protein